MEIPGSAALARVSFDLVSAFKSPSLLCSTLYRLPICLLFLSLISTHTYSYFPLKESNDDAVLLTQYKKFAGASLANAFDFVFTSGPTY